MSDAKIPAGWYPDPQDTTSDPRPERWWDGTGWTATTRPGTRNSEDDTAVLSGGPATVIEGEVLQSGPAVRFPEPPTEAVPPVDVLSGGHAEGGVDWSQPVARKPSLLKRISRPVLVTAAVAGLLGLAVGSGVTYLAVHKDGNQQSVASQQQNPVPPGHKRGGGTGSGSTGGVPGFPGTSGGAGASGGGSGALPGIPGLGGSGGGGGLGGLGSNQAIDLNNKIVLPVPSGWTGGTGNDGSAVLTIGSYTCPGASSGGGSGGSGGSSGSTATCSLGGANTGQLQGTDVAAAAKADITAAANESYPNSKGHTELESQAVTVDGRSGYLVRWKVSASQGNDGYVETVVFPSSTSGTLITLHLGFDIAAKAPDVSVMDTIVSGVTDFTGSITGGGSAGGSAGGTST